jgi:hypothetical protein
MLVTPGEQIIKYCSMFCLEIADTVRLMSFYTHPVCVDCFYMCCLLNFPTDNSHMGLDLANKQATKDD